MIRLLNYLLDKSYKLSSLVNELDHQADICHDNDPKSKMHEADHLLVDMVNAMKTYKLHYTMEERKADLAGSIVQQPDQDDTSSEVEVESEGEDEGQDDQCSSESEVDSLSSLCSLLDNSGRYCTVCLTRKPVDEFYTIKSKTNSYGKMMSRCAECYRKEQRERYQAKQNTEPPKKRGRTRMEFTDVQIAKIKRLRDEKYSLNKIAECMGCSNFVIQRILKEYA